jgi:glutamyl-tRNA synthetase
MHLGSARTALYDYLLARQSGGQFILRIEDTDRKRFVPGSEQELMDGLRWLGMEWDEGPDIGGPCGPYRQSERKAIYQQYAEQLIDAGQAYYCFCSTERLDAIRKDQQSRKETAHYDGHCRDLPIAESRARIAAGESYVIRFKMPQEGTTVVRDLLRGDITLENRMLDDYIIVKSDGLALYHLAAMVDDHLMGITHVIRGSEWLPTHPLHVNLIRAFGWEEPVWVHLSIFLKPSGKGKMSKREQAEFSRDGYSIFVKDLRSLGYMPEAVVNWVALMGWSYDDHTEFFTLPDLVEKFSLEKLNPAPAAINFTKLDYFNGLHIRALAIPELAQRLRYYFDAAQLPISDADLLRIAPLVQERMTTLDEGPELAGYFFRPYVTPSAADLTAKGLTPQQSADVARRILTILTGLPDVNHDTAEPPLRSLVEALELSAGQVFGIMRVAVTGQRVSLPLFESMEIIGRADVLSRLQQAVTILEAG